MKRASRLLVVVCVLFVAVVIWAALPRPKVMATPDYAARTGQPCGVCHISPQGGGGLTATGVSYAGGGYVWPIPAGVSGPKVHLPPWARAIKMIVGYIHLVTAVLWFGTILYIHLLIKPQQLTTGIPKAERKLGWTSIGVMAVTGSILTLFRYLEIGTVFTGTWGKVFAVKLAQFGIMVLAAAIATLVLDRRMRAAKRPQVTTSATPGGATDAITRESLASLDGKEGRKAVVAVDGKLYDVTASRLWKEGVHMRKHSAGQDLTEALKGAPHGPEVVERVPSLGALQTAPSAPGSAQRKGMTPHGAFVRLAYLNLFLVLGILLCVAWWKWGFSTQTATPTEQVATLSAESQQCIQCHTQNSFGRAQLDEWQGSVMAKAGTACYECHGAQPGDPDAMAHNGFTISVLVTPKDCGKCHVTQAAQFASSRHAQGGQILASLDNILGERVEGVAAAVLGCRQCHGSVVEIGADLKPTAATWPNTGIGRINPDGSLGACSTCHTRHLFSVAVGREPAACGNCHMGPDHPQIEIFNESKHGVAFMANRARMALDRRPWVLGQDYSAAPTCATCHMSATPGMAVNHDVGQRISWTLRPTVSVKLADADAKRARMQEACQQCHSPPFYQNYFAQYDQAVALYNAKFAQPAAAIMKALRAAGKLTALDFDEQIEWTYYLLWHHEGRRARHGAAMMGPDYVQWHGFFEVADRFYNELVPEAEKLLPGVTETFLQEDYHQWRVPK
jgi:predicted heme/steroid binding protein